MKKNPAGNKSFSKKKTSDSSPKGVQPEKRGKTMSSGSLKKTGAVPAFRSDPLKNDLVRQALITLLWKKEELTYPVLVEQIKKEVGKYFNSDLDLYIENVCGYLMEKKLLEVTPDKKPVHYRLAQKLDTDGDENSNDNGANEVDNEQEP